MYSPLLYSPETLNPLILQLPPSGLLTTHNNQCPYNLSHFHLGNLFNASKCIFGRQRRLTQSSPFPVPGQSWASRRPAAGLPRIAALKLCHSSDFTWGFSLYHLEVQDFVRKSEHVETEAAVLLFPRPSRWWRHLVCSDAAAEAPASGPQLHVCRQCAVLSQQRLCGTSSGSGILLTRASCKGQRQ